LEVISAVDSSINKNSHVHTTPFEPSDGWSSTNGRESAS